MAVDTLADFWRRDFGRGSKHVYTLIHYSCVFVRECVRNALISIDVARFKRIFDVRVDFFLLSYPHRNTSMCVCVYLN